MLFWRLQKRRGPINIPDLEWNLRVADPDIRISEDLLEAVKKHEGIVHNAALNTIEYKVSLHLYVDKSSG